MKRKLPKKILAAFLAVMMVATSVPFGAIAAYAATGYVDAATDEKVLAVENAMAAFKSKLATEGKSYSNVAPAYAAYVNCQQGLDAYIYGGEENALDGLADKLTTAMNDTNMPEFTGIAANSDRYRTTQIFVNDSTGYGAEDYAKAYSNLLWSETGISTDANDGKTSAETYSALTLFYPETVLLYDGKTTPATAMMAIASSEGSTAIGNSRTRYISAITSENASAGLSFDTNWHGTAGNNMDFNWAWITNGNNYNLSYNDVEGTVYRIRNGRTPENKYFANLIKYTGGDTVLGSNKWRVDIQPTVKGIIGSSNQFSSNFNDGANATVQGSTNIHVVNYNALIEAVKSAGDKMKNVDLAEYSQGGLVAYFTAMDAATSLDPNSYFTNTNAQSLDSDINAYCSAASGAVRKVNTASTDDTNAATGAGFQAVRDVMIPALRSTYAAGGDKYTTDSWNAFVTAYEAARDVMAATNDTALSADLSNATSIDYNKSDSNEYASTVAAALQEAYGALKTNVAKVDTSELFALIKQFETYDSDFFTADSYTNASNVVAKVKADVWGSEANWGVPAEAPDDDAEGVGKAKVAAAVEEYKAAFAALRINPAANVLTSQGTYSLNDAIALESKISDPTDYSNYSDFSDALAEAKTYQSKLADTAMTDYDTQYDEYVKYVDDVVKAYNGLTYSFTRIPDGTVFGNTGTATPITRMSLFDQGSNFVEGSYTPQGFIFKTSHEAKTVKFGDFNVTFGTIINSRVNNAIDSISINATAPKIGDNGSKAHITSAGWTSSPAALSADQKAQYAGCLSAKGFSVSNLRYTGRNNSNTSSYILTLNDGTQVNDYATAITTNLDSVLGTTDGANTNPMQGGVFAQSDGNDDEAYAYIKGDFSFDVPETAAQTLTRDTVPSLQSYELGTNFGAVTSWNCTNTSYYAGYNWLTSEMNNETLTPVVRVVDISSLVELVNKCNAILNDSQKYTDETWSKFTAALKAAQANVPYTTITSSQNLNTLVNSTLKTRYQNLWDAFEALEVKTLTVDIKYGKDLVSLDPAITVKYGETISDVDKARVNEILGQSYQADGYTWEVDSFDKEFNFDDPVTENVTLTVLYKQGDPLAADWTQYDNAKNALIAKLESGDKYSYTVLENVKSELAKLTLFTLTDDEKATYKSPQQALIDTEAATINSLASSLTALLLSSDVIQVAEAAQAQAGKDDTDMYDSVISKIDYKGDVEFDMITSDATSSNLVVTGYKYSTDAELENAIKATLNSLELKVYDIYVGDTKIGSAAYGTSVSVTPTGIIATDSTTTKADGANYKWTYSYTAPSRDPKFGTAAQDNATYATAPKYMITAPSFGFIVKGETHLTAEQANGRTDNVYTVTIKSGVTGKIIDVVNTEAGGTFTMPTAPSIPYYTFDSYSNGVAAGAKATVSADTVIVANYTADEENLYTVYVYNTIDDFNGMAANEVWDTTNSTGVENAHDSLKYNELVTVSIPDSYCLAKAKFDADSGNLLFTVLAIGDTYSFYANESIGDDVQETGIVGLSEEEYKTMQLENNDLASCLYDQQGNQILASGDEITGWVYKTPSFEVTNREEPVFADDNSKFSLIGTFICPTGYEMVEAGFLMTTDSSATQSDMTVENAANETKGVRRLKSSKYTVGNQFVINIKNTSTVKTFKYAAYAKYKDADGNIVTTYGKVVSGTNSSNLA